MGRGRASPGAARADDQGVLERCETLLDLVWVRERAHDASKEARAIALRGALTDLLPYGLDHPYAGVLRALAGLEPGTAGRSRDERQRIAGEWLGAARHPATPRSVRRRVRQHCWPWLLDRLIARELEQRDATDADDTPSRSPNPRYLALIPDLAAPLIERADQHRRLLGLLLSRDCGSAAAPRPPVVSVRGPAGFGKTTLAQQVCHSSAARSAFTDGLLWIETGEHCDPGRVVHLISDLCFQLEAERPEITDPEQAGFHLARVLGDRHILLVIDNVWAARDLSPFLIGAPSCTRLVTTRNARVCSSHTAELVLEPMSNREIERLMEMQLEGLSSDHVRPIAGACRGWPLLAQIVAGAVRQDVLAGASPERALTVAESELRSAGPGAFDVWDDDDRQATIHQAIDASLDSLERHVAVAGRQGIRDARIRSLAVDRGGDRLVSGGEDNAVCLWDLATRCLLDRFDWGRPVWCVAISPDAKFLAVGGEDRVLQLFDVESWQKLNEVIAHSDWVRAAAFSPSDGMLASGSGDRRVRVWSVDERLRRLDTFQAGSRVRSVAFSGDGNRVAAGCEDGIVRVWNRTTGPSRRPDRATRRSDRASHVDLLGRRGTGVVRRRKSHHLGPNRRRLRRWNSPHVEHQRWRKRACPREGPTPRLERRGRSAGQTSRRGHGRRAGPRLGR